MPAAKPSAAIFRMSPARSHCQANQQLDATWGNNLNVKQLIRRAGKLTLRKKAAAAGLAALFFTVLAGAYFRSGFILLPALVLMLVAVLAGVAKMDTALRQARRAAKVSALLPVPAPQPAAEGVGPAHWWGTKSNIPPAKLSQRLTKLRSFDGRDVLARSVTSGRLDWQQMEHTLELFRMGGQAQDSILNVLDSTAKGRLLVLADTCYRQNIRQDDILNAATIYQYVYGKLGPKHFQGKRRGEFFLDALAQTGRGDQTLELEGLCDADNKNPNDLHLYRANARNPFRDSSRTVDEWLAEINAMYEAAGLAPIRLKDCAEPAFLRLSADPVPAMTEGPLVTIVMPVFRPDAFTDLAIESALAQSYRNIEVIIVDDGSGDVLADRLEKWELADPRVKLVRNTLNSGAYTSRNIGYSMATGEFITVFDGDDWQHPQKIEMLVAGAVRQEDRALVSAPWSRVGEDLMFHYRGWRGAYVTPAHVSAMFPVSIIKERLGYWDTVRKAADTEFILRYQLLVNDKEVLEVTQAPLTLSLVGSTNLSMDDFRMGYRSPDRVAYRAAYEHWHRQIRHGHHSGYLDFPPGRRAFPAPARFLPARPEPVELDELFVGDFGAPRESAPAMWRDIDEARSAGRRVGMMHVPSILNTISFNTSFSEQMLDEFAAQRITRVELTDDLHSRIVNVYDPTSFQFTRELRGGHTADTIMVRASEPPFNPHTGVHTYAVTTVARNLGTIFGGAVQWTSEDPDVAAVLERTIGNPAPTEVPDSEVPKFLATVNQG